MGKDGVRMSLTDDGWTADPLIDDEPHCSERNPQRVLQGGE